MIPPPVVFKVRFQESYYVDPADPTVVQADFPSKEATEWSRARGAEIVDTSHESKFIFKDAQTVTMFMLKWGGR